jgi:hypothetical protein
MSLSDETRVKQLHGLFEGREAIYIEHGALRVKVSKIKDGTAQLSITTQVEEIPTAGFPVGSFPEITRRGRKPLRWNIEGGYLAAFSEYSWCMGYGGWSLFFAPKILDGVLSLARQFPDNLDARERYAEVLRYLQAHDAYQLTQHVFARGSKPEAM